MTAKIYDANKSELMAISGLEREGNELVIRGKIYGAMPMSARLRPEDVRNLLKLLNFKIILFAVSMLFRKPTGPHSR